METTQQDKNPEDAKTCEKCPAKAKVAKAHLLMRKLEVGKEYLYCTCGFSKTQPWCDDTCHTDENIKGWEPLKFSVEKEQTWHSLCGCKRTSNPPWCDGTHSTMDINDW